MAKKPAVAEAVQPQDDTPTVEQARAMFEQNPGLSSVVTTEGSLSRDGILTPALTGE